MQISIKKSNKTLNWKKCYHGFTSKIDFLSFKTKYEESNIKFKVTMTWFNEHSMKSKIRDFNYAFNLKWDT